MTSVGVGVLTYNHKRTGREEDFCRTWASIALGEYPAKVQLLTNGSSDGTEEVVEQLGGVVDNEDSRVWYGNTRLIELLSDNELIVLSADDLEYVPGWLRRVVSFMDAAPKEIALASCQMEPVWPWNEPTEIVEYGGEKALVRGSLPGSSWVFRTADWNEWMGPFDHIMPGEDLAVCNRIAARGYRMAALNLCEHIGIERSAWGNQSHLTAQPLGKEWQI